MSDEEQEALDTMFGSERDKKLTSAYLEILQTVNLEIEYGDKETPPTPSLSIPLTKLEGMIPISPPDTAYLGEHGCYNTNAGDQTTDRASRRAESETQSVECLYVDLEFEAESWKMLEGRSRPPWFGEIAVLRCYMSGDKKAVLERDDDLMTPEETREYVKEVRQAKLDELRR